LHSSSPFRRLPAPTTPKPSPPTLNDPALARRLNTALGVPGYYFAVGGTSQDVIDAAEAGGPRVPPHHSPLFRIDPEPAVRAGAALTAGGGHQLRVRSSQRIAGVALMP
jgi:hypothetical protein